MAPVWTLESLLSGHPLHLSWIRSRYLGPILGGSQQARKGLVHITMMHSLELFTLLPWPFITLYRPLLPSSNLRAGSQSTTPHRNDMHIATCGSYGSVAFLPWRTSPRDLAARCQARNSMKSASTATVGARFDRTVSLHRTLIDSLSRFPFAFTAVVFVTRFKQMSLVGKRKRF
jgi:hypothetical protein